MTIDLLILGNAPIETMLKRVRLAEDNGYDVAWLADERFYREVYSCLTHFALNTKRIKLGPCVTDPYARHPALTAMAIATLDEISGRRAMLGVGAGISGFAEMGVERLKPARAIRETVELVRLLLRGGQVTYEGQVIKFTEGRLSFTPVRNSIPVYIASNGPLGQKTAGAVADGAIMEACGNPLEVGAFRKVLDEGAMKEGRDPRSVKLVARLNTCIAADGKVARDTLRPTVARMLGAARLQFRTNAEQNLSLPADVVASVANAAYADGVKPYLHLLPMITDRHVNSFMLAGNTEEVAQRVAELMKAGVDSFIIMPFAPEGGTIEETIVRFGSEAWPMAQAKLKAG
jgi:5,10-methylenetetrahydromethanopterin reductase